MARRHRQSDASIQTMQADPESSDARFYSDWAERTFHIYSEDRCETKCQVYGEISFKDLQHQLPALDYLAAQRKPFIRVADNTDPSLLCQLLVEHWDLKLPRFVLSITGGATTFDLPPRLDQMIRQGLQKTAAASNSWIVTGGMNTGVMKYVGDALADVSNEQIGIPPLIGICPWNVLNNKEALCGQQYPEKQLGGRVALYGHPDESSETYKSLDKHHTHFLCVDNGSQDSSAFGAEIALRGKLEALLGRLSSSGEFGVAFPVACVSICIQGGPGTIDTVLAAVEGGTPVIIVNGSGKAANLIAYAYTMTHQPHNPDYSRGGLERLTKRMIPQVSSVGKLINKLQRIVANKDQVWIYNVDYFGSRTKGLDVCILDCVLKYEQKSTKSFVYRWMHGDDTTDDRYTMEKRASNDQPVSRVERREARLLELALLWRRFDIARDMAHRKRLIRDLTDTLEGDHAALQKLLLVKCRMLKWALSENRLEFVKLFFETMDEQDVQAFLKITTGDAMPAGSPTKRRFSRCFSWSVEPTGEMENVRARFKCAPMPPEVDSGQPPPIHLQDRVERLFLYRVEADLIMLRPGTVIRADWRAKSLKVQENAHTELLREEEAKEQLTAWHRLRDAERFVVNYIMSQGYMLSKQGSSCHTSISGLSDDTLKALTLQMCAGMQHLWVHRQLDDGWSHGPTLSHVRKTDPFLAAFDASYKPHSHVLPEEARRRLVDSVTNFLNVLRSHDYIIWQPDTLEDLYIQASTPNAISENDQAQVVAAKFKNGRFWMTSIHEEYQGSMQHTYRPSDAKFKALSPYFHLFLWAIYCNRVDMVVYFWKLSREFCIPNALIGSKLASDMASSQSQKPAEISNGYESIAKVLLNHARALLQQMYKADYVLALRVLHAELPQAGYVPTWKLADLSRDGEFVSLPAMLRVITDEWYGEIDETEAVWKVALAALVPLWILIPAHPRGVGSVHLGSGIRQYIGIRIRQSRVVQKAAKKANRLAARRATFMMQAHHGSRQLRNPAERQHHFMVESSLSATNWESAPNTVDSSFSFSQASKERLTFFYQAPIVKFVLQTLSYILLLMIFSLSAFQPTRPLLKSFQVCSLLTGLLARWQLTRIQQGYFTISFVWLFTMIVDEIRQIIILSPRKWWESGWNRVDAITYILYATSLGLRASRNLSRARNIYSTVAMVLWVRLARQYAVSTRLGPKLVMIQLMVKDILVFLALMFVIFAGYAVALYATTHEEESFSSSSLYELIFIPYFQVYGELFLEEIADKTTCKNLEFTDCGGGYGYFAGVLIAFYMMIGNILLLNLLIAILSSTYEAVESHAKQLWAVENLDALLEFTTASTLPAPFHFLNNVILVLKVAQQRWCPRSASPFSASRLVNEDTASQPADLSEFSLVEASSYIRKLDQEEEQGAKLRATVAANQVALERIQIKLHHIAEAATETHV
eukprot:m.42265 g.42265  ORF g.42265 m.42265 type:complete len:1442 (+) comp12868_c0_seq3:49-4374(+)